MISSTGNNAHHPSSLNFFTSRFCCVWMKPSFWSRDRWRFRPSVDDRKKIHRITTAGSRALLTQITVGAVSKKRAIHMNFIPAFMPCRMWLRYVRLFPAANSGDSSLSSRAIRRSKKFKITAVGSTEWRGRTLPPPRTKALEKLQNALTELC